MTKLKKFSIIYLFVITTASLILNLVILNKKTPPTAQLVPVQTEKPIITSNTDLETKSTSDSAKITEELKAIRDELSKIRADQRSQCQTLGTTDAESLLLEETLSATPIATLPPAMGLLTLNSLTSANVYKEKSDSSVSVGRIYFGKNYPYYQKQDSWYLIKQETFQGWIKASLVQEIK